MPARPVLSDDLQAQDRGSRTPGETAPPAGQALHYVVRAENGESFSTGPNNGGVKNANLVHVTATNETAQPSPGDVGDSLRLAPVNQAHTRLEWTATAGAAAYHV